MEPGLWTGIGRARSGCGAALVGSVDQVMTKLERYQRMGIRAFVLSGYPHLEEAHRFAELVFPLLPLEVQRKLPGRTLTGPFGEIVANAYVPQPAAADSAKGAAHSATPQAQERANVPA